MDLSIQYAHGASLTFGGLTPQPDIRAASAVVLPIPYERTTSYMTGTRTGPREILAASGQVELWDDETETDVVTGRVFTLPEMDFPDADPAVAIDQIRAVARQLAASNRFPVFLGGEHSITPPLVEAMAEHMADLSVLQIDAHADLRESYLGSRQSHACAMRRVQERVPCTQVAIRSLSREEHEALPSLNTRIFFDRTMRAHADWMDRVVETLGPRVYLTIDCDGLDPAIMPAVGTPEPGGLSWYETLTLLRRVFAAREVVACDVVELCPIPGLVAPNFICAKLVYKILTYKLGGLRAR